MTNTRVVNNDFHENYKIFEIFEGLEVKDIDSTVPTAPAPVEQHTNGDTNGDSHASAVDQPLVLN